MGSKRASTFDEFSLRWNADEVKTRDPIYMGLETFPDIEQDPHVLSRFHGSYTYEMWSLGFIQIREGGAIMA